MKKTNINAETMIEGVPPISWAKTGDCSYAAALEAALKVTKHPYSYSDIMGYSVLAFRTRWRGLKSKKSEPWWCGSIPVGEFEEEVNRTSEITGWNIFATGMFESKPEKLKEYIPKVVDSINKGFPVVAYPTMKNLNCGVIYGYQVKNGKLKFYWRDLFKGNEEYLQDADETGPLLFFLESWKKPVSAKERFLSSLVQAVYNWSRAPLGTPSYYTWSYGKEAFEIWTNDLRNGSKYSENLLKEFFFVNAWNYSTLRDARKHAVKFLEENKDQLPKKEQKNLEEAIDLYKREVKLLVGSSDLFKGPMNKKELKDWTQSERDKAAEVLTKLSVLENQAMDIFGKILKSGKKNY